MEFGDDRLFRCPLRAVPPAKSHRLDDVVPPDGVVERWRRSRPELIAPRHDPWRDPAPLRRDHRVLGGRDIEAGTAPCDVLDGPVRSVVRPPERNLHRDVLAERRAAVGGVAFRSDRGTERRVDRRPLLRHEFQQDPPCGRGGRGFGGRVPGRSYVNLEGRITPIDRIHRVKHCGMHHR